MDNFKFFAGISSSRQLIPIITTDTNSVFMIPTDLFGKVLNIALAIHRGAQYLNYPTFYRNYDGSAFHFRVTNVEPFVRGMITINYIILFPNTVTFKKFSTTKSV